MLASLQDLFYIKLRKKSIDIDTIFKFLFNIIACTTQVIMLVKRDEYFDEENINERLFPDPYKKVGGLINLGAEESDWLKMPFHMGIITFVTWI